MDSSARTPWMIGSENFPSERSSANPFSVEYCRNVNRSQIRNKVKDTVNICDVRGKRASEMTYGLALEINVIVANLIIDPYKTHKWNVISIIVHSPVKHEQRIRVRTGGKTY